MSTAALAPVRLVIARESASPASSEFVLERLKDEGVVARELASIVQRTQGVRSRAHVVELKPRAFGETAAHLLKVARRIDWPVEDPDED